MNDQETEERIRTLAVELHDLGLLYGRVVASRPKDVDEQRRRAADLTVIQWKSRRRRDELVSVGLTDELLTRIERER